MVDCCVACGTLLPLTIRIRLLLHSIVDEVDCCVLIPLLAATILSKNYRNFFLILLLYSGWLLRWFSPSPPPRTPYRISIDCCVVCVGWGGLSGLYLYVRRWIGSLCHRPSSVHLLAASAVFVTVMAAESPPATPKEVGEAFVMVLMRFGVDWVAMWRRPAWLFSFLVLGRW